jgi:hypothetical protein
MDKAHLSAWLHCLTSSPQLEHALDPTEKDLQSCLLDLPYSYGGAYMKSLSRPADEELLGSFASIASSLIFCCMQTTLRIYIRIVEAVEALANTGDMVGVEDQTNPTPMLKATRNVAERTELAFSPLSADELNFASQLIMGHSVTDVSGKWNRSTNTAPENVVLPETRLLTDFISSPCKHEVGLMKQTRHVRQASILFNKMDRVRQTLMRATAGQCGRDSAHCSLYH